MVFAGLGSGVDMVRCKDTKAITDNLKSRQLLPFPSVHQISDDIPVYFGKLGQENLLKMVR